MISNLRNEAENESSMDYWYPMVKDHLPCPKTESITLPDDVINTFRKAIYGRAEKDIIEENLVVIKEVANRIGYPLFMRSDQGSGKHDWETTCYVKSEEDLCQNIFNLFGWHEMAGIMGLSYKSLYFRELLDIEPLFIAFWGNMPIGKERRVFVRDGKVLCIHPYWEQEAILSSNKHPLPDDWQQIVADSNNVEDGIEILTEYGEKFSQLVPGYWSVDFIQDRFGKWWFIDAARGEISWHPEPCEHIIRFENSMM